MGKVMTMVYTSPQKVIEQIAAKGISGCVVLHDPNDNFVSWHLHIGGGQLHYATSDNGKAERLYCILRRSNPDLAELEFVDGHLEYGNICQWWYSKGMPAAGLRQLLTRLSMEALVYALAMPQTNAELIPFSKIDPILVSTSLHPLPAPLLPVVVQWKKWRSNIYSPFSRLYLDNQNVGAFKELWQQRQKVSKAEPGSLFDPQRLPFIIRTLQQKYSLYRMALVLKVQVQMLTAWLQPFLAKKLVTTVSFKELQLQDNIATPPPVETKDVENKPRLVIACIDDSSTVQRQVQGILEMSGYDVLSITDPTQALTSLVRQKPAAILMDVNMPDINGYELSSMLRQSKQLRDIPIMMLTGRDGIMDRMKARMLGINYYLTKPFHPQRLLENLQKLVNNVPPDSQ